MEHIDEVKNVKIMALQIKLQLNQINGTFSLEYMDWIIFSARY